MSRRRIRTLKPEFFEDEKVTAISIPARLTVVGLITIADDRGRLRDQLPSILGDIYPAGDVSMVQLKKWLEEAVVIGLARRYAVVPNGYLWLPRFLRHQVIQKPTESDLPPHPEDPWAAMSLLDALKAAKRRELAEQSLTPLVEVQENYDSSTVGVSPYVRSVPFRSLSVGETGLEEQPDLDAGATGFALTVAQVCRILGADAVERVAVENAMGMYPKVDHVNGARLATTWAIAPDWTMPIVATFRSALKNLDEQARKAPSADAKTATADRRRAAAMNQYGKDAA